jgi:exodeoxyribonuclease-3
MAEKRAKKTDSRASKKTAVKTVKKSARKTAETVAKKATSKPTEKATGKVIKKPPEKAAKKTDGTAKRSSAAPKKSSLPEERFAFQERELPAWPTGQTTLKLYSWNVNGIRAVSKKGFFDWLDQADPDIFCLQETRARTPQVVKEEQARPLLEDDRYCWYWANAEKGGYSGVATFSKYKPASYQSGFINDPADRNYNSEGRVVITEYPGFVLWNVYFPNGGRGPERVEYKLAFYEHCLDLWQKTRSEGKRIIITGDYNTAHKEIDLARPKENAKVTGFLPEERAFLDKMESLGYIDIFRRYDASPEKYTYWDQFTRARERNAGWRIDYFWISEETLPIIKNAWIEMDVMGSDHCPVGLEVIVD